MENEPTKQRITRVASMLFYQKGFQGTSVRDIAKQADVNLSAISYYFKGKQGLLEYTVTTYFENYLAVLEKAYVQTDDFSNINRLKQMVETIVTFKQKYEHLSRFIYRELAFDSTFVREVVVIYLAKENYYIREVFFSILKSGNIPEKEQPFLFMQFIGMLTTPYLLHQEVRNQAIGITEKNAFAKHYIKGIYNWIDSIIKSENKGGN